MKKVLFATTALIATAGVAAADVTLSGSGRIGVVRNQTAGSAATNIVDNRVNIDIRASGETDAFSFSGLLRIRSTNGVATVNAGRVSITSGGLTVHGGNIPGPLDNMAGVYAYTVGYTGGTFQASVTNGDSLAYSSGGAGAQGIQANYTMGDFTIMAAHQPATDINQIVAQVKVGDLTVAAGSQMASGTASDVTAATVSYKFGDFTGTYGWGQAGTTDIVTTTFSLGGTIAPDTAAKIYMSQRDGTAGDAWGVGATYNLGGGARLGAAFENRYDGTTRTEIGLALSF